MKQILLSISALFLGTTVWSQVIVAGVSPASIVGNYEFGEQTHEGWPGQTGDGTWNLAMDFNIPGTYIIDTLMLVEDGTTGTNPQGNPISQEGCGPLINDLTGKIAVIYRNTCEFGTKILNAQNAGAVAAIIINRDPVSNFNMLGGTDGINVTIPAVFLSSIDGELLVNEMSNGPVVMFIGNKIGAFMNDVGSDKAAALISPYGSADADVFDGFDPGIEIYNWGANPQSNVWVHATITTGSNGTVYMDSVGPLSMASGDTISIFNGNPESFNVFDLGTFGDYPNDQYTLTYEIDLGVTDDSDYDNVFTSTFHVNGNSPSSDGLISLSRSSGGSVIATNYPSNSTTEYQGCMFYEETGTASGAYPLAGIQFIPYTDTSATPLAGEEIFINVFEWNDTWVDLTDPNPQTNNDWFTSLNPIGFETYYPASDNETGQVVYKQFSNVINLVDGQRYLICLQTFNPEVSFGYDYFLDYDANQAITAMPISPVFIDDTWYTGGWNGASAISLGLQKAYVGVNELNGELNAKAFPNPANDVVTISLSTNGNGNLTVTDVSGKVALSNGIQFENNLSSVNIESLATGVYVFNITMEDGSQTQFNVVKQ